MRGNPAWKPGVSGNPAGKPPGPNKNRTLSDGLKAKLQEICDKEPWKSRGQTWRDYVVDCVLEQVHLGNPQAMKLVFERLEGKVPLAVNVDGGLTLTPAPGPSLWDSATDAELKEAGQVLQRLRESARARQQAIDVTPTGAGTTSRALPQDVGRPAWLGAAAVRVMAPAPQGAASTASPGDAELEARLVEIEAVYQRRLAEIEAEFGPDEESAE